MKKITRIIHDLHFLNLFKLVIARFNQERCMDMASSLTFTTLLSLVPLITIALTFFSAFPQFADFLMQAKNIIHANMLPETGGKIISQYMAQFADNAAKLTAVGIIFLAVTAMMLIYSIDNAFNRIWRVTRQRALIQRVLVYWAVLTLAPLLMGGSLSITSWLIAISVGHFSQLSAVALGLLKLVPLLLATLTFAFLFRVVPNRFVPFRHALIGGAISALAFETMNRAFALYISHFPTYKLVYGAFASFPIFLLWVYLSWMTVLLGAVLTSSLSHWRSKNSISEQSPAIRLYYSLCILKVLGESLRSGEIQNLPRLSKKLLLGFDFLEVLLEKMATIKLVQKAAGNNWVMVRAPEHVQAIELYRLFVFDPGRLPVERHNEGIQAWLARLSEHNAKTASVTLHTLFNEMAPEN
ncbi:MAG: YihY family inner membrane protein [Gallionellaceae bacterium]|jgi:membrane protein